MINKLRIKFLKWQMGRILLRAQANKIEMEIFKKNSPSWRILNKKGHEIMARYNIKKLIILDLEKPNETW